MTCTDPIEIERRLIEYISLFNLNSTSGDFESFNAQMRELDMRYGRDSNAEHIWISYVLKGFSRWEAHIDWRMRVESNIWESNTYTRSDNGLAIQALRSIWAKYGGAYSWESISLYARRCFDKLPKSFK